MDIFGQLMADSQPEENKPTQSNQENDLGNSFTNEEKERITKFLEEIRYESSMHLMKNPGEIFLPGANRPVSVIPPTGPLLALDSSGLLPCTLQKAVSEQIQKMYKGQKLNSSTIQIPNEVVQEKIKFLLNNYLLRDAKYEDFTDEVDIYILEQFCIGRLEPLLPEHLTQFATGILRDLVDAYEIPPSEYINEFLPGCKLRGTVTGFCLDLAGAMWASFLKDYRQSLGVAKMAQETIGSIM